MEGSQVLARITQHAPAVPDFMTSGSDYSHGVLQEALLIREGHEMQREIIKAKHVLAKTTLSEDLACVMDARRVDEQIERVRYLQRMLQVADTQLPALQAELQKQAAEAASSRAPVEFCQRRHAVTLAHDMVRLLAHGTEPTAAAMRFLQDNRKSLTTDTPARAASALASQATALFEEMDTLLAVLDKLESRTANAP